MAGRRVQTALRYAIPKETYFQAHNSGFNDYMAWETSTSRYDSQIEFWDNACKLKRQVEVRCNIYKEELEEDTKQLRLCQHYRG